MYRRANSNIRQGGQEGDVDEVPDAQERYSGCGHGHRVAAARELALGRPHWLCVGVVVCVLSQQNVGAKRLREWPPMRRKGVGVVGE